jgi:hypothetical protein
LPAKVTVSEDYEQVSFEDEAAIVARIVADPSRLGVARAAVEACAEHHGVDNERARAELRLLCATALAAGAYQRSDTGFWVIRFKRMTARLTPPGGAVVSYATRHYERLPSEVIAGDPSRFGRDRDRPPAGPPLSIEDIRARLGDDPRFSERLVASWSKRRQLDSDDAVGELAELVAADLINGAWRKPPDRSGNWELTTATRAWAIRADTALVVATWDPAAPRHG